MHVAEYRLYGYLGREAGLVVCAVAPRRFGKSAVWARAFLTVDEDAPVVDWASFGGRPVRMDDSCAESLARSYVEQGAGFVNAYLWRSALDRESESDHFSTICHLFDTKDMDRYRLSDLDLVSWVIQRPQIVTALSSSLDHGPLRERLELHLEMASEIEPVEVRWSGERD